jgi:hypothetical protein
VSMAQELIASVHDIGGEIDLRGERIHFRLPRTPDAPRLVEQLRTHREEVIAALRERAGMAPCGSPHCAGCYDVGEGRKIHPPRCGEDFLRWRAWLEGKGRPQ